MKYRAVVDTNVIVSALVTKNPSSPPREIFRAMLSGRLIPLYHADIMAEYEDVLSRKKFNLNPETVRIVLNAIELYGEEVIPAPTGIILPDIDDLIFYEVAMERRRDNAYLVTGNIKHFPDESFVVTLAEMLDILNQSGEHISQ